MKLKKIKSVLLVLVLLSSTAPTAIAEPGDGAFGELGEIILGCCGAVVGVAGVAVTAAVAFAPEEGYNHEIFCDELDENDTNEEVDQPKYYVRCCDAFSVEFRQYNSNNTIDDYCNKAIKGKSDKFLVPARTGITGFPCKKSASSKSDYSAFCQKKENMEELMETSRVLTVSAKAWGGSLIVVFLFITVGSIYTCFKNM